MNIFYASHARQLQVSGWVVLATALITVAAGQSAQAQFPKAPAAPGSNASAEDWLGISSLELSDRERAALKILDVKGAPVVGVFPGSPAEAAGLRLGDVIVEINGRAIQSSEQLAKWNEPAAKNADAPEPVANPVPVGKAVVVYQRDGVRWRVALQPVAPPADLAAALLKPAEAGQAWAQYELAGLLRTVNPPDSLQAQVWLKKASDQGLAAAQAALGMMVLGGEGSAADPKQGTELLVSAGVAGLESARYGLGLAYLHGIGVEPNLTVAAFWFHEGAEAGHAPSQFLMGCLYEELQPPDHVGALFWLKQAGEQNLSEANVLISTYHRNGWGVPKSDAEANRYLLLAANAGHAHAQYLFGEVCSQALGVQQDDETAVGWYRAAANKGDVDAQRALGVCYKKGIGVAADLKEAGRWLEKAAEAGDADAQFYRAVAATTPEDGLPWLKRAAVAGNADAQFNLANYYLYGNGQLVPKSKTAAAYWYRKAIAQGREDAKQQYDTIFRN